MPRIAIIGLHLEANAFAPPTIEADFRSQCWEEGEAITRLARAPSSHMPAEIAGFYRRMDETGAWTPVPIAIWAAPPGGPIEQALLLRFLDTVQAGLSAALPVDAVYVPNHGASSATGDEDSDGTLVTMIRRIVGPGVPIVVSHDLHCNVSARLVQAADSLIAYRTNPHVDMAARAAESADMLRLLLAGTRVHTHFIRLPLTPPSVTLLTAEGPYADLIREAEATMAREADVLNVSVTGGFTFSDLPKCGMTFTVTAINAEAARAHAERIARMAWDQRHRHTRKLLSVPDAVALARDTAERVIFSDAGDNPGGGGRGNTAWLLEALHEARVPGVVLGLFVDPALAAEAHALGEGVEFEARFNREPSEFSRPFAARARVAMLSDGRGVGRRGTVAGRQFNLGPAARLTLLDSGMEVVVISLRRQCHEPRTLEMHGLDLHAARCIVVKSRGHFRAGFDEFAPPERIFEVDTAGLTSPVLTNFAWKRLPRPVYPLDADAVWP
ncbi:MAG: M81 family metallopeptidase [Alphaproteobacteria bacterium]|nr:M81 family metallopeptidase [Alphaproteobacteria bacterium]